MERGSDVAPKAAASDFLGRFREVVSDPNNRRIPRVTLAGFVGQDERSGDPYVVMHNGIRVLLGKDAYYDAYSQLLIINRGVHEPQEEYAFGEVLKCCDPRLPMFELGSYWAFYSLWYLREFPSAAAFLCEPDAARLESGRRNFALNGAKGEFIHQGIGPGGFDLPGFVARRGIDRIGLLHVDIEGAEGYLLPQIAPLLDEQRVDHLFLSTHSQALHVSSIERLRSAGYRIIGAADFDNDTFACDGLVVAASARSRAAVLELYSRAANHRIETVKLQ
jgi:hypothetical protein